MIVSNGGFYTEARCTKDVNNNNIGGQLVLHSGVLNFVVSVVTFLVYITFLVSETQLFIKS